MDSVREGKRNQGTIERLEGKVYRKMLPGLLQMVLNMNTVRKEYFGKQFKWHIVGKVGKSGIAAVQVGLRKNQQKNEESLKRLSPGFDRRPLLTGILIPETRLCQYSICEKSKCSD